MTSNDVRKLVLADWNPRVVNLFNEGKGYRPTHFFKYYNSRLIPASAAFGLYGYDPNKISEAYEVVYKISKNGKLKIDIRALPKEEIIAKTQTYPFSD